VESAAGPGRETKRLDKAYQELPMLRHETKDVLRQMQVHIQQLEDLTGRLGFVLSEVRTLLIRT